MLGVVAVVLLVFVVLPVGFCVTGGVITWYLGGRLRTNAESTHAGSELIETNI